MSIQHKCLLPVKYLRVGWMPCQRLGWGLYGVLLVTLSYKVGFDLTEVAYGLYAAPCLGGGGIGYIKDIE